MLYRHNFVSINDTFIEIKSILRADAPLRQLGEVWDTGGAAFMRWRKRRKVS
jgi:hypothetical protein